MDLAPVLPAIALATLVALLLALLSSGSRARRSRRRPEDGEGAPVFFRRHRVDPPNEAPARRD
jgi:hypothetical protein